ncbi:MAG: M36 family metallopeptidase [Ferruginibacter sp.]|nr:M36 family metallopeptidase [Ferruginibacter sp.]
MKKHLLLFFALIYCITGIAQFNKEENQLALALVKANSKALSLSDKDMDNLLVSSTYQTTTDRIRMVYLQQTFKGIPVFNQMQVLAFKNSELVSASGGRITGIEQLVNNPAAAPKVMARDAVIAAIRNRDLPVPVVITALQQKEGKTVFGRLGIALQDITAELVWLPVNSKEVRLAWEIELVPQKSADHWMIRVDAANSVILDKNNLTVYEHLPETVNNISITPAGSNGNDINGSTGNIPNSPLVVNAATYRVVPYPAESPIHAGGTAALVTDPWNLSAGNAVSLKWHFDGTTYHDSTRGNNVWAQEDRDNNNNTFGKTAISTTAQPTLSFDFVPNFTLAPTVTVNQQFATTNLFYWNNIMHDISYLYGFDEPSGNFQASNQGRGGAGNDYVIADAQDAGGTSNANFSTPVDGSRPRMQMYLFTGTTPNRDGDLDNGVVNHEYTHGISNRLTGGPANSSCLANAEQGGEGWSDYFALMTTTNWATAQVTDGALSRPLGTYVLGQPVTGAGIRTYPYSTNLSVNPWTYASMAGSGGEVHVIGEIWCAALWDMTWEMIAQDGINPNLFNATATGGNTAAMKLVMEGMRLQPCSPGYIDARNAILKADTLFFAAKYSCSIWKAFAKRGMGKFASQGSSNSTTDQVASFVDNSGLGLLLTQNVTSQQEGLNVTYTNHVSAGTCGSLSNYVLTDTLPANVTYLSGGAYNAGTRVVSFPVNIAQGGSQDYAFTVTINTGSYFSPVSLINEQVTGTAGTIPPGWTAASTTTSVWTTHNTRSNSAPNSFFTSNRTTVSDQTLATTGSFALGTTPPNLSFWHWYNAEPAWDGGVVEISTNGGTIWSDLGPKIISGNYNGSLSSSTNPLSGRLAFTGNSGAFVKTVVDLSSYANQNAKFRFRFGSDGSVAAIGWNVDDILLQSTAIVNMRSNLYNGLNVKVSISDTITNILPSSCITGTITTQPSGASVCAGANAALDIVASGSSLSYQWQLSTDGGSSYSNIAAETIATLSLTAVTAGMNNYKYRCQVSGACTPVINSGTATLTVNALPQPASAFNGARCDQGSINISASAGAGETIDWYAAASGGAPLTTGTLSFSTPVIGTTTSYYAESRNTTTGCIAASRTGVTAAINLSPSAPSVLGNAVCGPGTVTLSATPGTGETIDWYATVSGGTALPSSSSVFTTPVINATTAYYTEARNIATGCISFTRTAVTATVNALPVEPAGTGDAGCGTTVLTIFAAAGSGETIDWYATPSGGSALSIGSSSFTTPSISSTIGYYAAARNITTGCSSLLRTAVTATINQATNSITHISICATALPYIWNNNSFSSGGVYTVTLLNSAGCDSLAKLFLDVAAAINIQTVTGGGSYTIGGSGVSVGLVSSESGVNYQLYADGSSVGAVVAGTGGSISFGNQLQEGVYSVVATTFVCSQTMSGTVTVSIVSGPPAVFTVTGGGTYCAGGTGISVGLAGSQTGINYQLQRSNGTVNVGSVVTGTGTAISFGLQTVAADYSVLATNTVSLFTQVMLNGVTIRIAALRSPSAPGVITGNADACPYIGNGTVTYTIRQAANATSYLWTTPSGATIIGNNTDTSVVVSYGASFVSGNLSVISVNSCFGNAASTARSLAIVRKLPSTPGTITPSLSNPCSIVGTGSTSTYTIRQVANATSYNWTLSGGITLIANPGDTGIVVRFEPGFASGTVSVVASNNCATSTGRALAVTAKIPATPGTITGITNVCSFVGQATSATFSISSVPEAGSYLWTAPANATIVSGQGTTSVQVNFAAGFTGGSLTVRSVGVCGNSAVRSLALVKNVARPGVISASAAACPSSTVTYSIAAVPYAVSYIWSIPANATYVSGQGTLSFTVSYKPAFVSGTITVKSVNDCSTSAVNSLAVAASGCALFTSARSTGVDVPVNDAQELNIFPNPNNGLFTISWNAGITTGKVSVRLIDIYGNTVKEQKVTAAKDGSVKATMDASMLTGGMYELRCFNGRMVSSKKVVIIK